MRRSQVITLASAAVLGLIAVVIVFFALKRPASAPLAAAPPETVATVVATTKISFGDRLSADKLKIVKLPPGAVPEGAFHLTAQVTGDGSHIALKPIAANEIILPAAVSGRGNRLSTMDLISPSMRAVSVTVTEQSGVAGLVAPGDRVDVYVTRTPPDRPKRVDVSLGRSVSAAAAPEPAAPAAASTKAAVVGRAAGPGTFTGLSATATEATKPTPITDMLVQGARVLAIGQNFRVETEKPEIVKTATLEVTPEQAAKLTLGQTVGTLTLALRPLADEAPTRVPVLHVDDLHDGSRRTVAHAVHVVRTVRRAPAPPMVEIVRGGGKDKTSTTVYAVTG